MDRVLLINKVEVDALAPVLDLSSIRLILVAARLLPTGGTGQVTDRLDDILSSWLAEQVRTFGFGNRGRPTLIRESYRKI